MPTHLDNPQILCNTTLDNAGWSSLEARRAHNPKVAGSNPAPATTYKAQYPEHGCFNASLGVLLFARVDWIPPILTTS